MRQQSGLLDFLASAWLDARSVGPVTLFGVGFQRVFERVVHGIQILKLNSSARGWWNFVHVALVYRRQQDRGDARALGGEPLFLDAADRHHEAAQTDFAG